MLLSSEPEHILWAKILRKSLNGLYGHPLILSPYFELDIYTEQDWQLKIYEQNTQDKEVFISFLRNMKALSTVYFLPK